MKISPIWYEIWYIYIVKMIQYNVSGQNAVS